VERKVGSGRRRSSRTTQNIDAVEDLIVSQEDKPRTHRSTRQISRENGVSQSSVVRIVKNDLSLKCFKRRTAQELTASNRVALLIRLRQLLKRYPEHEVALMWLLIKRFSLSWRSQIRRTIVCMLPLICSRNRLLPNNFFAHETRLASRLWFHLVCLNWAVRSCFSSIQVRK